MKLEFTFSIKQEIVNDNFKLAESNEFKIDILKTYYNVYM